MAGFAMVYAEVVRVGLDGGNFKGGEGFALVRKDELGVERCGAGDGGRGGKRRGSEDR